jgi:regulatory protein
VIMTRIKSLSKPMRFNHLEKSPKITTPEQALVKLQTFCAYQERCPQEVEQKLKNLNISGEAADKIVDRLIEDNFLNEERFAMSFARGKFRIKSWGKIRIRQELKLRRIPDRLVKQALNGLDTEGGYLATLERVLTHKLNEAGDMEKAAAAALRKGFEPDLVWDCVRKLRL